MKKILILLLFICSISFGQTTTWQTQSNGSLVATSAATYTVLTDFTENVTTLPMSAGGTPYIRKVVFSIALPTIPVGSIMQIHGGGEVTNNNGYNVGKVALFIIGNTDTTTDTYVGNGAIQVTPPNGDNIINSGHNHGVMNRSVDYMNASQLSGKYLNYVWYGYSSAASGGDVLDVPSGYGWLTVTILKGQ